jgi:hypothetical protein
MGQINIESLYQALLGFSGIAATLLLWLISEIREALSEKNHVYLTMFRRILKFLINADGWYWASTFVFWVCGIFSLVYTIFSHLCLLNKVSFSFFLLGVSFTIVGIIYCIQSWRVFFNLCPHAFKSLEELVEEFHKGINEGK